MKKIFKNFNKILFRLFLVILVSSMINVNGAQALTSAQLKKQKAAEAEAARVQAAEKQKQAEQFQVQITNLDKSVSQTESSIGTTETKISETSDNIKSLESQIKIKEDELTREKDRMNQLLTSWYMEGESGLLQAIIGSNNLSEVVTKQEYYDAIKQQVESSIGTITEIKSGLTTQKLDQETKSRELAQLKFDQESYVTTLESQKQQKNSMLNMTIQQKAQYLEIAKKAEQEVARISAEEEARRRAATNISSNGTGGYPYGNSDALDPWMFYQLQCTSYAAWYWNNRLGKEWYNTQPGTGSAKYWDQIANTLGYSASSTPRVGAIVSWKGPLYSGDQWGHVAIVEKVNANGTIDLSEYNWIPYHYSYRTNVSPASYGSFVYIY